MLPIQKYNEIIQQINRVLSRVQHVKQVKNYTLRLISQISQLNSQFSEKISEAMTKFEEFFRKNSLYYQKADHIVDFAKLYRQFAIQINRNSKDNLTSIQRLQQQNIEKVQTRLKQKCQYCVKQFRKYSQNQVVYNQKFMIYSNNCRELRQNITKYKSHRNPILFYQKNLTHQYIATLDKNFQQCSTNQQEMGTCCQIIDQKRAYLTENIKDVNQLYFVFVHSYLSIISKITKCIVYPRKQFENQKKEITCRITNHKKLGQEHKKKDLQQFQIKHKNQDIAKQHRCGNFFDQFSELFKKFISQNEVSSDYRLFYDRCSSILSKKIQSSGEAYKLQNYLFNELKLQKDGYYDYEKSYKQIQKNVFGNFGIQNFKKKFRKYFGANFAEILELCLSLLEGYKKSLQMICKNMQQGHQKMKKILDNKKQAISAFERRSSIILQAHLKIKDRYSKQALDSPQLNRAKTGVSQSYNQLKKIFMQFQTSQRQDEKRYFAYLSNLCQTIMEQNTNRTIIELFQTQKNKMSIHNSISIDRQVLSILKDDSRYENLLNQCPKSNLYLNFVSLIDKLEYQETIILLKKKESGIKNMIKPKLGCCGMKSQVIRRKSHSQHDCKLIDQKEKYKGTLNISQLGIIFQEHVWNPFCQGFKLIVPQNDIKSFDIKQFRQKQVVEIQTLFGTLRFDSKEKEQILKSLKNNTNFKPIREVSQKAKKNDSASFLQNNSSTDFKLSFEKTINSNELSRVINNANSRVQLQKYPNKPKTVQNQLKDLARKWKDAQFFPTDKFTKAQLKHNSQRNILRRDYHYKHRHSKFYLKEKRQCNIIDKQLILKYEWKISFPELPMLYSFKHHQEIRVQNGKDIKIKIIAGKHQEQQLYIKYSFYNEIQEMNKLVCQFIALILEKKVDIFSQQEDTKHQNLESYTIVIDGINFEQKDSRIQMAQSYRKNLKEERPFIQNGSKKLL